MILHCRSNVFLAIQVVSGDLRLGGWCRSIPLLSLFHLAISVSTMVIGIGKPKAVTTEHSRSIFGQMLDFPNTAHVVGGGGQVNGRRRSGKVPEAESSPHHVHPEYL
ncbi:hypothetical protein JCGZ_24190 [Jatropha curcas]|uniref:Uncharacterized protein n=1 Tax=Jatropha curcas TaxID=180498 RepID=A0A067JMQ5_JATCU|nr:hypothetical protein JCGZ_24190 [Jatropha curcas]